ncbi:MAG: PAS domain-containing sensor histidine kinase [Methanoregula sp.]|nr:PAS domain-containing sensor histidine kinase [Methanoregula sp.]
MDLLFPGETRTASMTLIQKLFKGERWETVEIPILTKDGTIRTVIWNSANVLDVNGTIVSTIAQGVDITERKQAEVALQQANKQLNLLSSVTRHDILNQLMALKGYLELSLDVIDKPEALKEFIKKEQHAANVIDEQITFTRDYQELGVSASAWQNVNEGIRNAMVALPMRAVHIEPDPADPEVYADPLLEKVFYNLIDNALRYGGADLKTIRVSSAESNPGLTIICEDNGVGITAEDKKKLFTKGFGKNTGLGLFLSREILAITGITITENGVPGKGARFEIAVPKGMWRMKGVDA